MNYREYHGNRTEFYETTPEVAEIVNLAIRLGRPVLVEGEAGCGKTLLAKSIAHELELIDQYVVLSIKSTSQAKGLLYRFDALRRLQDAQMRDDEEAATRARSVYHYIELQPLGRVIQQGKPSVILIDEIDKADIDFPNDLLDVLGEFSFTIEDLPVEESELCRQARGFGRSLASPGGVKPVVVITSNREKQLPEAFLRRCLYINLRFPEDDAQLARIVQKNLRADGISVPGRRVMATVESFRRVRKKASEQTMQKLPATSELVDWIKVLTWRQVTEEALKREGEFPPYWRTLFKTMQDLTAYEATADASTKS